MVPSDLIKVTQRHHEECPSQPCANTFRPPRRFRSGPHDRSLHSSATDEGVTEGPRKAAPLKGKGLLAYGAGGRRMVSEKPPWPREVERLAQRHRACSGPGRGPGTHLDERVVDLHVRLDEAPAAHHHVLGAVRGSHAAQQKHQSGGHHHRPRRPSAPANPHDRTPSTQPSAGPRVPPLTPHAARCFLLGGSLTAQAPPRRRHACSLRPHAHALRQDDPSARSATKRDHLCPLEAWRTPRTDRSR